MANPESLDKTDSAVCKAQANTQDKSSLHTSENKRHPDCLDAIAAWTTPIANVASSKLAQVAKKVEEWLNPKDFTPSLCLDVVHDANAALTKKWADRIAESSLQKAAQEKLEGGIVSEEERKKLANYAPTGEELHAFRHAMMSAVYAAKYGSWITERLGAAAELGEALLADINTVNSQHQKKEARLISGCDLWSYKFRLESNADLLNNKNGPIIAEKLRKQKGEWFLTTPDLQSLVKSVAKAELNGRFCVNFAKTWDSGKRSSDLQYFPRVPNSKDQSLEDALRLNTPRLF